MSGQMEISIVDEPISQSQASTEEDNADKKLLDELREAKSKIHKDREDTLEGQQEVSNETKRIKIQRVPEIMMRNDIDVNIKSHFTPKKLSIGPFHGANNGSLLLEERQKHRLAAHFISESGNEEDFLFEEMKTAFKEGVKKYFNENEISSYSDRELLRLVFLDGCAMLGFIRSHVARRLSEFGISDVEAELIKQDLFLLENQIPFKVLQVLMNCGKEQEENERLKNVFFDFVYHMSNTTFPRIFMPHMENRFFRYLSREENVQQPVHILDLFREVILFDSLHDQFRRTLVAVGAVFSDSFCFLVNCICCCIPILLFCCMMRCFSKLNRPTRDKHPSKYSSKISFRRVQELKTVGIRLSPSDSLRAISFHSLFFMRAKLKLPTLVVDGSTETKLFNLIAYEMCLQKYDHPNRDPWVTSFVKLLDLLIDGEEDVKDLRAADILRNRLSSDDVVSHKINSIGSYCIEPLNDTFVNVTRKIQKHYERRCAIWMAQVWHAHFSSPWTILGLFAAITALVLTAIQTWCAIFNA